MNIFKEFADLAGSLICHQLPSRSLFVNGMQLPVCARDTGIYLGIFVSTVFIIFSGRRRSDKPPGIHAAIALCIFMLPMMIDGVCSYLGIYETNNTVRLLTGAFFGLPIPIFLIPAANFKLHGKNEIAVLKGFYELAGIGCAALIISLMLLNGLIPYAVITIVFVISFFFLLGRISYTVISRAFRLSPVYRLLFSAGAAFCILAVLYLISSFILQPVKAVFLR